MSNPPPYTSPPTYLTQDYEIFLQAFWPLAGTLTLGVSFNGLTHPNYDHFRVFHSTSGDPTTATDVSGPITGQPATFTPPQPPADGATNYYWAVGFNSGETLATLASSCAACQNTFTGGGGVASGVDFDSGQLGPFTVPMFVSGVVDELIIDYSGSFTETHPPTIATGQGFTQLFAWTGAAYLQISPPPNWNVGDISSNPAFDFPLTFALHSEPLFSWLRVTAGGLVSQDPSNGPQTANFAFSLSASYTGHQGTLIDWPPVPKGNPNAPVPLPPSAWGGGASGGASAPQPVPLPCIPCCNSCCAMPCKPGSYQL